MDFSRYDEGLFKGHNRMKNLAQLGHDSDSLQQQRDKQIEKLKPRIQSNYFVQNKATKRKIKQKIDKNAVADSTLKQQLNQSLIENFPIANIDSVFETLDAQKKVMILENAVRRARDTKAQIDEQLIKIDKVDYHLVRHKIEWHRKFTLSFACFIFFFIGAPLGAIIRKGGLGMPVVISVLFFIVYYIIDTFGLKASKEEVWPPYMGMWLSSVVLFPIGVFLTYKAATDSAILNSDAT
ncbi:putative permease [Saccharicrinis fermentans DSM 9555 = JCM 21142]|uniref:Putative permease n=2 Tax=Saccharicrinis fermentans TaxID=982 RepID=W7Y0C9_9BACT|nr:putative permease [Saccharicrinis fermentans DSM 9555 = JCM 21142]